MVRIDLYGKESCELCAHTKRKLDVLLKRWGYDANVKIFYWDLDTVDGLTEATFNDVHRTPTTTVSREGKHVARWEGEVPDSRALKLCIDTGTLPR